jgi:FtsH-binding integral membrane protein
MSGGGVLRAYWAAGAGFLAAAVVVAGVSAASPFERGWWLASYLLLVGGVSQVPLGGGQYMVAACRHAAPPAHGLSWAQFALWNIGTAAVAVADVARVMPGVAAGSAILIVALVLFCAGLRRAGWTARRRTPALEGAYLMMLVVLAGCVVLGTFLAGAAPGQ